MNSNPSTGILTAPSPATTAGTSCMIGSDECLKGDTFGGLIVAAVALDAQGEQTLMNLGVTDSKKIGDARIPVLADLIRQHAIATAIRILSPADYNREVGWKVGATTILLNRLHNEVGRELKRNTSVGPSSQHIVDQYPGCTAGNKCETKAESKFLAVAAASILAREAGLIQFANLSASAGFTIPKGSTHVKKAMKTLKDKGLNPDDYLKRHFKNVQAIFPLP